MWLFRTLKLLIFRPSTLRLAQSRCLRSNSEPSTCLSSSAYGSAERDRAKCEAPGRFIRNGRLRLVLEEVKISQGAARVGTYA